MTTILENGDTQGTKRVYRETGYETRQGEAIVAAQFRRGRGPICGWRAFIRDETWGYSPQHGGQTCTTRYPALRDLSGEFVEHPDYYELKRCISTLPFVVKS